MTETPQLLLSISDFSDDMIARLLARATALEVSDIAIQAPSRRVVGLLFAEPSLRTRVGFTVAASLLGWTTVDAFGLRAGSGPVAERFEDTLRTFSGMVDVVVARPGRPAERDLIALAAAAHVINAGDTGFRAEHPTQALIDLHAIQREVGSVEAARIAICGDIETRCVRSLLGLLDRWRPARLVLATSRESAERLSVPEGLLSTIEFLPVEKLQEIDVLYVSGIPHGSFGEADRGKLRITADVLASLPPEAVVLSPLPLIDEMDMESRRDPRVRMFEQSDRGVYVRAAILEEFTHT